MTIRISLPHARIACEWLGVHAFIGSWNGSCQGPHTNHLVTWPAWMMEWATPHIRVDFPGFGCQLLTRLYRGGVLLEEDLGRLQPYRSVSKEAGQREKVTGKGETEHGTWASQCQ